MPDSDDDAVRLESDIQHDILAYLVRCGLLAWRNNQGSMFVDSEDQKGRLRKRRVRFSTMEGLSDLQGIIPAPVTSIRFGVPFFIEVKRPGQKPTKKQKIFLSAATRYGAVAFVADSVEAVRREFISRGFIMPAI